MEQDTLRQARYYLRLNALRSAYHNVRILPHLPMAKWPRALKATAIWVGIAVLGPMWWLRRSGLLHEWESRSR